MVPISFASLGIPEPPFCTPHSQVAREDAWTEKGDHATREAVVTTRKLCNVPSSAARAEARLNGVEKERERKVKPEVVVVRLEKQVTCPSRHKGEKKKKKKKIPKKK